MVTIRTRITFFLLALIVTAMIGVSSASGQSAELSSQQQLHPAFGEINGDTIRIGDVIATGIKREDGSCDFAAIQIRTTAPGEGKTKWIGIVLDAEQCQAMVNADWVGTLEDGPQDIVGPLMKLLPMASPPISESPALPLQTFKSQPSLQRASTIKTSEQHIFMYGYGGKWDKLTHKYGKITFSYDGSSATIISQSGSCQGSKPAFWYEWVVDGCFLTSVNYGPSDEVWRGGRGDYHCDPANTFPCNISNPDGYYHSLYDREDGHFNGVSHCTFSWSGTIVKGVDREILQGCN